MYDLHKLAIQWQESWYEDMEISSYSRLYELDRVDPVFELLVTAYTQPDRHYHNLHHIEHLLTILAPFNQGKLRDPMAVFLAIWFHDFVYDPQLVDNEIQSAKAARELLTNLGGSIDLIGHVEQLILATQGHRASPEDFDKCVFLDADLAILGADPIAYQVYARSIRLEYSWVSDAAYRAGRIQVLESFLQRDRLYYTDLLFNELESLARHNIHQEIANLTSYPNA
jgi:predicted metal-dependent HD superfamily phosphohydrolase